jgi:hypothetical protein
MSGRAVGFFAPFDVMSRQREGGGCNEGLICGWCIGGA